MPKGKHLTGATAKEQREYEHLKESSKKSGLYGKKTKGIPAGGVGKPKPRSLRDF